MAAKSPSGATDWAAEAQPRLGPRRLLRLIAPALRLVWRASPRETVNLLLLTTLSGLTLPVQVLAGKWALDAVLEASRGGGAMDAALPEVAVALVAMTVGQLLASAARQRQRLLPEMTAQAAQEMLSQKAVSLDLEALETPAFHDRLVRAQQEAVFRPAGMVQDGARIVTSAVAVVGLAVLLLTVHPLLLVLLGVAVLPLWWASISGGRAYYRYSVRRTPRRRLISYLQSMLTLLDSAKETRAFGLGGYLVTEQRRLGGSPAARALAPLGGEPQLHLPGRAGAGPEERVDRDRPGGDGGARGRERGGKDDPGKAAVSPL